MWAKGFVAASVAVGEPWTEARKAIDDAAAASAKDLCKTLDQDDRQKKAEALAKELGVIARDLEKMEASWGS